MGDGRGGRRAAGEHLRGGGGSAARVAAAPRASCEQCNRLKKKCFYAGASETCERCRRLGHLCTPQTSQLSRRAREQLRKAERAQATGDTGGASPPEDAESDTAGDEPSGLAAEDGGSGRPPSLEVSVALALARGFSSASAGMPCSAGVANADSGVLFGWSPVSRLPGSPTSSIPLAVPPDFLSPQLQARLPSPSPEMAIYAGLDLPESLLDAVAAYWETFHPLYPVLHRATLEAALSRPGYTPFGAHRPLALLHVVAAIGLRGRPLDGPDEAERLRAARHCIERALQMLAAGYVAHQNSAASDGMPCGQPDPPISDLEAVCCIGIIVAVLVPSGMPDRWFPLLRCGVRAARALYMRCHAGPPADAREWVGGEMAVRNWIGLCSLDLGMAYHSGAEPVGRYFFHHRMRLPAHERFWDHPNAEVAYGMVFGPGGIGPAYVDFAAPDRTSGPRLIWELIHPIFDRRASILAAFHLCNYLRYLRMQIFLFGRDRGIESTPALANAQRTPDETTYLRRVDLFETLCAETHRAMPPEIGAALARGDPRPFYARAPSFAEHPLQAHQLMTFLLTVRSYSVEHYLRDAPGTGPIPLSPAELARVAACAAAFASALSGPYADRADETPHNYLLLSPAFKVGRAALAAAAGPGIAGAQEEEARAAARAVARCLDAVGRNVGLQTRKVAASFRKAMRELGIDVASPRVPHDAEAGEPQASEIGGTFLDVVVRSVATVSVR